MGKSLVRGSLALAVADFSKKALLAATVLLCARAVPKVIFGDYMFLMSFYQIFSVIAGSGVPNILVRDIARHREWMPQHAVGSVIVRLAYAVPAILLMFAFFLFGKYSHALLLPLASLALLMVLRAMTENAISIFQGREDVSSCAAISIVQSSVTVISTAVVCLTTKSLFHLVLCHSLGAACSSIYALYRFHSRHLPLTPGVTGSLAIAREFFYATAWNNGATLVSSAYNRCDVLLLQRLASPEAVATYSAPYRILDLAQILPTSVMGIVVPRLSRSKHDGSSALDQNQLLAILLMAALVFIVVSSVVAPWIVPLVLGKSYATSVPVVEVLVWATPLMFSNYLLNSNFILNHFERFIFFTSTLALFINLSTNLFLIPRFGYMGASFATVLTEFLLLVLNMYFCRRASLFFSPAWAGRLTISYIGCLAASLLWANPSKGLKEAAALLFVCCLLPMVQTATALLKTLQTDLASTV